MAKESPKTPTGKWSAKVTRESHALDLEEGVFTWKDPKRIARSLKMSADVSKNLKRLRFVLPCLCSRFILIGQVRISVKIRNEFSSRQRKNCENSTAMPDRRMQRQKCDIHVLPIAHSFTIIGIRVRRLRRKKSWSTGVQSNQNRGNRDEEI